MKHGNTHTLPLPDDPSGGRQSISPNMKNAADGLLESLDEDIAQLDELIRALEEHTPRIDFP